MNFSIFFCTLYLDENFLLDSSCQYLQTLKTGFSNSSASASKKIKCPPFTPIVDLAIFRVFAIYRATSGGSALIWRPRVTEVRHWIDISTMESLKILLPVWPEVTFKVISRSNIDIILKIQHFERRFQRAGPMTFKVTLKVTGVSFAQPNKQASTKFLLIRTPLDQTCTMVSHTSACHQLEKAPYLLGRRVRVITGGNMGPLPADRPQGVVSYLLFERNGPYQPLMATIRRFSDSFFFFFFF